jgi:zinc transporter ZupT
MDEGKSSESMYTLVISSVVGAVFYTVVNKWLTGGKHTSATHGAKQDERESLEREAEELALAKKKRLSAKDGYDDDEEESGKNKKKPTGKVVKKDDYEKVETVEEGEGSGDEGGGNNVAFSIWLGILIDGVPESMLIGFMQSEGELSVAFIVAVFLANFPEAMSSAALM